MNNIFFQSKREELYDILVYCKEFVPYYKENSEYVVPNYDDFDYFYWKNKIPVLDKKVLIDNYEAFISAEYEKEGLITDVTSGTEGKPLICYKSKKERIRSSNLLWKYRRKHNKEVCVRSKFLRFYAYRENENNLITNQVLYKGNDILIPLFDFSEKKINEYCEAIAEFEPIWIHGPSTAIFNIAKHIRENNLYVPNIKLIELNGEFVVDEQKKYIEQVFQSKVVNHYGSREFWCIAFSNAKDELEILDSSVFVESIMNEEIAERELIITTLKNMAWPLLKYKIGDLGDVTECCNSNANKRNFKLLLKRGRRADYFRLENNQLINAILFSGIIRGISDINKKAKVYQFQIQKISDCKLKLIMCMNLKEKYDIDKYLKNMDKEIRKTIGSNIEIIYSIVDEIIPDKKTGKCRDFLDLSKENYNE